MLLDSFASRVVAWQGVAGGARCPLSLQQPHTGVRGGHAAPLRGGAGVIAETVEAVLGEGVGDGELCNLFVVVTENLPKHEVVVASD